MQVREGARPRSPRVRGELIALGFAEPLRVAELMARFERPWAFCGGWAIDLFLGRATRGHKDVDIAIARRDQLALQAYLTVRGWSLAVAHHGELAPWVEGAYIELPRHGIWATNAAYRPGFVEVLLNEVDGEYCRFRKDPSIAVDLELAFMCSRAGLPLLAPEIVLLYKAGDAANPENTADFRAALPALDAVRRHWLKAALGRLYADHAWVEYL